MHPNLALCVEWGSHLPPPTRHHEGVKEAEEGWCVCGHDSNTRDECTPTSQARSLYKGLDVGDVTSAGTRVPPGQEKLIQAKTRQMLLLN